MRNYYISHQTLCINKIDFDNNWICGHTELIIWPLDPSMVRIHLNAKQIRIHSTQLCTIHNDVSIMEVDLAMSYHDPFMAISRKSDYNFFNLDNFIKMHIASAKRVDLEEGIGELTLQIPPEFWSYISELKPLKLIVEFSLYRPKAGLYFVKPSNNKNENSNGAYLFTSTMGNMSRLWFPCVDCSEPCTWKIEITVNEDMVAISNGLLLDSVYTPDLHSKVYHYFLKQPVPASCIGMVVGEFEIYPDPVINHVIHFCPPKFMPLLKTTVEAIPPIFKFIEDKLNFNYPFDMYKTVFVDNAFEDFHSYASMTIFDLNLLHPNNMLDQNLITIQTMSLAIPEQFFGNFTVMKSWAHAWVPWGISGYLGRLYLKILMGNNEYRYNVRKEMDEVVNYEEQNGGIILDPSECKNLPNYNFSLQFAQASNATYIGMYKKKAALIVRLLELKMGPSMILKVFRKLLLLAAMAQNTTIDTNYNLAAPVPDEHRSNLLLCADLLKYSVDLVSGSQITNFLEMWVNKPGHVRLQAEYQFNRRRNVAELSVKQFHHRIRGCFEYTGPIEVVTQEFEGFFRQKVRIDRPANTSQSRIVVDIPLHTKVRKHRKRKVTLSNGTEVDIDLPPNDNDIPYLWIMLDVNMALFGKIDLIQPDRICLLILRHEQDALAQISAIETISAVRDASYLSLLRDIAQNNKTFYQTRMHAAIGMKDIMNNIHQVNQGGLRDVFTTLFYTKTGKSMICSNDFRNLGNYRLQVTIIRQLALLQTSHGLCPSDIPTLLFNLLLYNDNSSNRYCDVHYKCEIIRAMGDAIRMGVFHRGDSSLEFLPPDIKMILKDVLRCLTLDQAMPSYKFAITQPCLAILRRLQEYGYIADEPSIFYPYVSDNFMYDVRRTALGCLISAVDGMKNYEVLEWLMVELIMNDNFCARLRFDTVNGLVEKFQSNNYSTNRQDIYRMYWSQILPQLYRFVDCQASSDWRLRSAMITLTKCIADIGSNNSNCHDHNSVGRNTTPRDISDSMPFESGGHRINIFDACRSPQRQNDISRLSDDSDVEIL